MFKTIFTKQLKLTTFCIFVGVCRQVGFYTMFFDVMKERGTQQQTANRSGTATQYGKGILDSPGGEMSTTC